MTLTDKSCQIQVISIVPCDNLWLRWHSKGDAS